MKKKKKISIILNTLIHKVKLTHLVILILLIISNTMAWMIYMNSVSTSIDVHIQTWKVNFKDEDGEEITENYVMAADNVEPGMETFSKEIYVENQGEVNATLTYTIMKVRIFDDSVIYSREGALAEGLSNYNTYPTSSELVQKLANDYPFKINFVLTNSTFDEIEDGEDTTSDAKFTAQVIWPYEATTYSFENKVTAAQACNCGLTCGTTNDSTNNTCYDTTCGVEECYTTKILELSDLDDTEWGERAYTYKQANPSEPSITIDVQLKVSQITS